jgi:hypothetical protein
MVLPPAVLPIINDPRVHLINKQNAYSSAFVHRMFVDKNVKFDVFIDDGPHTLESMKDAIRLYLPCLAEDGIFVIEDVAYRSWLKQLKSVTPVEDHKYIVMLDLQETKVSPYDRLFVINREKY